jgi:hypothetical protein
MQALRRVLLIFVTIFALTGVAGATPLKGLSDVATLIADSAKLNRPQIERAWWYYYHRHHHYHHWRHHYSSRPADPDRHIDPDQNTPERATTQEHHWWDD